MLLVFKPYLVTECTYIPFNVYQIQRQSDSTFALCKNKKKNKNKEKEKHKENE